MQIGRVATAVLSAFSACRPVPVPARRLTRSFSELNDRPIIGVAAQETATGDPHGDTYILATYVKYLEQAGARVVPVRAGEADGYYTDLFSKLNGLLFPGGSVNLTTSQYARTGRIFYNLCLQAGDRDEVFPLWGTCLGLQLLTVLTAGQDLLRDTDTEGLIMPLDFEPDYRKSRMLGKIPENLLSYLRNEPVTQNEHKYGMLVDVFNSNTELKNFYRVLSTNVGKNGVRFISTFEAFNYPIYGTQWHPEKNSFSWNPRNVINHSEHAVKVTQYFANFFVHEARKSPHRFPTVAEESEALIDNFKPVYFTDGSFSEVYFFNFTDPVLRAKRLAM